MVSSAASQLAPLAAIVLVGYLTAAVVLGRFLGFNGRMSQETLLDEWQLSWTRIASDASDSDLEVLHDDWRWVMKELARRGDSAGSDSAAWRVEIILAEIEARNPHLF